MADNKIIVTARLDPETVSKLDELVKHYSSPTSTASRRHVFEEAIKQLYKKELS